MLLLAFVIAVTHPAEVRKDIGNGELRNLQASGARVVDVREPGEYALGHIQGAENVPLGSLQAAAQAWDPGQPIVVYCATGARSANAAAYLAGKGFQKVYNLKAGIASWDGPLTKTEGPPPAAIKTNGKPILLNFFSDT